jgi:hypothetical protein
VPRSLSTEQAAELGRRRWAGTTREERAAEMLPVHIAAAVQRVVDAAPILTDDQRTRLRAIFLTPPEGDGS